MPHSVVFQFGARSTLLSLPVTLLADPEPIDSDTASLPPAAAVPTSLRVPSCFAVIAVTCFAALLVKQSVWNVNQPAGQVALKSISQYCMKISPVPSPLAVYTNCCHAWHLAGLLLPLQAGLPVKNSLLI